MIKFIIAMKSFPVTIAVGDPTNLKLFTFEVTKEQWGDIMDTILDTKGKKYRGEVIWGIDGVPLGDGTKFGDVGNEPKATPIVSFEDFFRDVTY